LTLNEGLTPYIGYKFFLVWEMSQTEIVEKNETYILCTITFFFWKYCCSGDNVEKCGRQIGHT